MIYSGQPGVKAAARPVPRIGVPFAAIPLDVKARRDVSPAAKLVFVTIANQARMRRGEVSNLTNRQISDRVGLGVATVRRALDQLEALGLVRRLFGDSKRTRLGVAVAYSPAEVGPRCATSNPGVAREQQPGCSPAPQGGCAPAPTDLLRKGEELSETVSRSRGQEDEAALRVAEGPEAAAYLKACIAAGRRGQPMPPPPLPAKASRAPQGEPQARAAVSPAPAVERPATGKPGPSPAPLLSPDFALTEIARMTRGLAEGLKLEDLGRRRVGPAKLARQLGELRRRHGAQRPSGSGGSRAGGL